MTTVMPFATPADIADLRREFLALQAFVQEFVSSQDDEVDTKTALKLTGIKSRTTLIMERERPGTLLKHAKHGRSTSYSRASCIAYKRAKRRG
ncbi:hypothetical protein GCM10023185_07180 [Hymenobacter saemangeumensis]|uniref:DNA-binding protein n=1 Tax=Hymenobacter saemangeumensis TaxID=1084522 RepID=A0ABP8I304_9BACT